MNLAFTLARVAQRSPERPAVYHGKQLIWSYGEFADRAARLANTFLNTLRMQPGDRIGIFMSNRPEYFEVMYAIWYAGLVAVPINAKLHPNEAAYILQDAGAAAVFSCAELDAGLEGLQPALTIHRFVAGIAEYKQLFDASLLAEPVARDENDLAWLFYTSGTTGRPKGVMLSHTNLMAMVACYYTGVDAVETTDTAIYAAPLSHGAGLYALPYFLKGTKHVIPESGGFDAAELVDLAAHHRQLAMFAAPTMVKRLVEHVKSTGADNEGFKTIVYGGGPMYVEDIRKALHVMGNKFAQIYGQGETPMTISSMPKEDFFDADQARLDKRLASVGTAQALVEIKIADAEGKPLPVGTPGEIMVRGITVMRGYWNNSEATEKAIRDGWLITGDIGSLDAEGFLTLRDRSKDVIISGGSNIYPREVEEALLTMPGVAEVSVVGMPDPEWGEIVVAFVVLTRDVNISEAALDDHCLANIARFKRPKRYIMVSKLPKNNYGKVLKTELRAQLAELNTH